ncbi:MAG TPA: phenylalanine--tRNA ligase beta subunit-related protein [Candidatus Nanoarchaeia archaeon]|nr:phenylalanine--tRNA ligase beta subunit-related protein [Candidatus Nanoarchaeia archaeon]
MKYVLSQEILEKFPTTQLGIITLRNIDNSKNNSEILALLKSAEESIKEVFKEINPSEHERIKCWREVYSAFGAKPKKYNCSIEAMSKRILENEQIPDISDIVNLYNYISLKNLISAGGDDSDKIEGDITLTLAKGDEIFTEIGQEEPKNPNPGEAIFIDDKSVLGRRWNWRQSNKTRITKESKNINLQLEGVFPVTKEDIEASAQELISLLKKFFNAECKFYLINKENPVAEIIK